ncbi:hypothetical protein OQJ05_09225 [Fluoribacter gormanii]|uniref:hypothetical protein n=1 Tax=Fluoribacter gormanii TaxID=464 RepID=UPI0022434279|nr:hypothetical protein [Fluoribacter gormanii]MCW8444228.1 hypothetical protein [Fluoribacter gormanii]
MQQNFQNLTNMYLSFTLNVYNVQLLTFKNKLDFMNTSDMFSLEYKFGTQLYLLSKTEIRCIVQSQPKKNFCIPLNQINPHYIYGGFWQPFYLLLLGYISFGIIVRSNQWLSKSPRFDMFGTTQLIVYLFIFIFASYKFFCQYKERCTFRFSFLHDDTIIAFSLPNDPINKKKNQAFLEAIVNRIHEAAPSNEDTLFLLQRYELLTPIELTQLETSIYQTQDDIDLNKKIINLPK